jgi:hypothetical protein
MNKTISSNHHLNFIFLMMAMVYTVVPPLSQKTEEKLGRESDPTVVCVVFTINESSRAARVRR